MKKNSRWAYNENTDITFSDEFFEVGNDTVEIVIYEKLTGKKLDVYINGDLVFNKEL